MDTGKGVRKYGRREQALLWGKYLAHQAIVVPSALIAGAACIFGSLGVMLGLFGLFFLPDKFIENSSSKVSSGLRFLLISAGIAVVSGWFFRLYMKAPVGNVLNPTPPKKEFPLLPDADLLVRASSSSAAQPAELLRAARETTEQKPKELLRAGTEQRDAGE